MYCSSAGVSKMLLFSGCQDADNILHSNPNPKSSNAKGPRMQTKSETRNPKSKPKAPIPKSEPPSRFPVPQDGFTYEREAIEASLQHRERSPKTNLKMGRKATRRFCDCGAFYMFCLIYGSWLVMKAIAEMMSSGMWILSLLGRSRGLLDTAAATFDGAVSFFRMFRVDGLQEVRTSWVWERSRLITQYRYIRTPAPRVHTYLVCTSMHPIMSKSPAGKASL